MTAVDLEELLSSSSSSSSVLKLGASLLVMEPGRVWVEGCGVDKRPEHLHTSDSTASVMNASFFQNVFLI